VEYQKSDTRDLANEAHRGDPPGRSCMEGRNGESNGSVPDRLWVFTMDRTCVKITSQHKSCRGHSSRQGGKSISKGV